MGGRRLAMATLLKPVKHRRNLNAVLQICEDELVFMPVLDLDNRILNLSNR